MKEQTRKDVIRTVNRLRLVQADCSDAEPDRRAECLTGELEESLKEIPLEQRREFLEELLRQFSWHEASDRQANVGSVPPPHPAKPTNDPNTLVSLLLEALPRLAAEDRERIKARLHEAGLWQAKSMASPSPAVQQLMSELKLTGKSGVSEENLAKLAAPFVSHLLKVESLMGQAWKSLSLARGKGRPPDGLQEIVRQALGDDSDSMRKLVDELDDVYLALTALLEGMGLCGNALSGSLHGKLKPEGIKQRIGTSHFGTLPWLAEAKCWTEYCEVARDVLQPHALQRDIDRAIAECVNKRWDELHAPKSKDRKDK